MFFFAADVFSFEEGVSVAVDFVNDLGGDDLLSRGRIELHFQNRLLLLLFVRGAIDELVASGEFISQQNGLGGQRGGSSKTQ
jgi:hypothetical protein